MKRLLNKFLLLTLIISLYLSPSTNSFFSDKENSNGNTFRAGCWAPPSTPTLLSPANNYLANQTSSWYQNPVMDWADSSFVCPDTTARYQYESYRDPTLSQLAYRSNWLSQSFIPAPNTPDGVYYWRVKACNTNDLTKCSDWSTVWKLTVDSLPPSAPVNLGWDNPDLACGAFTNNPTILANWDNVIDGNGISKYEYQINYPKTDGTTGIWNTFVTSSQYFGSFNQGQGLHTYRVRAYDFVGNISPWSNSCSITYDTLMPQSIITSPGIECSNILNCRYNLDNEINQIYLWNGKIKGTASDSGSGINQVELNIFRKELKLSWDGHHWVYDPDQTILVTADGTEIWNYDIDIIIPLGKFVLTSHAVDNAGNIENSYVVEFENIETDPNAPPPVLSADFYYNYTDNNIYLKIDNIDLTTLPLNYEIIYLSAGIEKGIVALINTTDVIDHTFSLQEFLGTESDGVFSRDPNLTLVKLNISDQSDTLLIHQTIDILP